MKVKWYIIGIPIVICTGILIIFQLAKDQQFPQKLVVLASEPQVKIGNEWYANEFGKEHFSAQLLGKKDKNGSLKLIWRFTGWPDELTGVIVKRFKNKQWKPLTKADDIIRPGIFKRDWSVSGMNAEQSHFYQTIQEELLSQGKIKILSPDEIMSSLRKYGMRTGDRIRIARDNASAFLQGFGAIDNSKEPAEKYGIFGMTIMGEEITRPLAIWENRKATPKILEFSSLHCSIFMDKVKLAWTIPENNRNIWGINNFNIYKKNGDSWKFLGDSYGTLSYIDKLSDCRKRQDYQIRPKNYLNEELEGIDITYTPEKYGNLTQLKFEVPRKEADHAIRLSWSIGSDDAEKINFFQLTRREAWGEEKIVLAKQLSGNSPYIFTDKTEKKCNVQYVYELTALLNNGNEKTVEINVDSPIPQPRLPAPKNFKVEIVKKAEKEYKLHFSWDPVPGAEKYLFYLKDMSRDTEFRQNGTKTGTFEKDYPASFQSFVFSYAIQALSPDLTLIGSSELSVVENVELLAIEPERVENVTYSQNAGEVSLSWKNIDPSTTGLEIFINGESYQKLPPTATSITISEIKKTKKGNKTGWVDIDIVNYNPMGKNKTYCGFMYYITPPEARKFPKIENFQGRYVEKDGQHGIELTWTPLDLKKLKLSGYDLTLYIRKGTAEACHSLCDEYKENHYFYAIPAEVSPGSELEFKIQAMQAKREKWPPTILRGPWVSTKFVAR